MSDDIWSALESAPTQSAPVDVWGSLESGKAPLSATTPEPSYDAALFRSRVGRDPSPSELANFAASKGSGFTGDTNAPSAAGTFLGLGENTLSGVTGGAGSLADAVTGSAPGTHDWAYEPRTDVGKAIGQSQGKLASQAGTKIFDSVIGPAVKEAGGNVEAARQTLAESVPEALGAVGTVTGIGGLIRGGLVPGFGKFADQEMRATPAGIGNQQSISAAAAAAPVGTPQGLLADFERHGVQPLEGQLTRDPAQFSAEQNSTNPGLVRHINAQEQQMTDALDNIRREAAPGTVQNNPIENGQIVVDNLKRFDEPVRADITAKYKALTDANGGSVPIDTGAFTANVDAALKKNYLTNSLPPSANELVSSLRDGEPLDFEGFEAARSRLAEAQRNGGSEGAAARIVRNNLEQMPLSDAAQGLKGLADQARSAAKARFDALDADPAYQAAADEASSGIKQGQPSPLADRFLDKYVTGASAPKANVDTLMSKLDDEGKSAVASHTLSTIRASAIKPNGTVSPNGFNSAMQKFSPKLDSLVTPDTADSLDSLGRVITAAKVPPAGNFVNYSKSGVIMNAAQGVGGAVLNAKTFGMGVPIIRGLAESKFAKRALNPQIEPFLKMGNP